MRITDFLPIMEGRDAPLYHGTVLKSAEKALHIDQLLARTTHRINGVPTNGVSLSRDLRSSRRFGPLVFVLDQSKLVRNRKIVPVDYYSITPPTHADELYGDGDDPEFQRRRDHYAEAEEFAIGGIPKLSRYLTAILFFKPSRVIFGNDLNIEDFPTLANHPLLKIKNV